VPTKKGGHSLEPTPTPTPKPTSKLTSPTAASQNRRRAVAAAVTSLGALLAAVPELAEIEINPLRAAADGRLIALDVVIGAAPDTGTVDTGARPPALAALSDGQGGH
jgi:succinyl-CoA synthetase beta subunit